MGDTTPSERTWMSGLPKDMDAAQLKEVLGAYGTIKDAKILGNGGSAIVVFSSLDEAKWVVENLDGNMPEGITQPIQVQYAWSRGGSGGGGGWGKADGKGESGGWTGKSSPYGGKGWGKEGGGGSIQMLKSSLISMNVLPGGRSSKERSDAQQLYIRGLPPDTTDADLHDIFGPFGAIPAKGVKAVLSPEGQCTGVGWVDFVDESAAAKAAQTLNGTFLPDGSTLRVTIKNSTKGKGKGKSE